MFNQIKEHMETSPKRVTDVEKGKVRRMILATLMTIQQSKTVSDAIKACDFLKNVKVNLISSINVHVILHYDGFFFQAQLYFSRCWALFDYPSDVDTLLHRLIPKSLKVVIAMAKGKNIPEETFQQYTQDDSPCLLLVKLISLIFHEEFPLMDVEVRDLKSMGSKITG